MIVSVFEGDTLQSIAKKYHTTPAAIDEENQLGLDPLLAGMRLVVHGYILHLWLRGDTVDSIAATYGVAVNAVTATGTPKEGQMIKINV